MKRQRAPFKASVQHWTLLAVILAFACIINFVPSPSLAVTLPPDPTDEVSINQLIAGIQARLARATQTNDNLQLGETFKFYVLEDDSLNGVYELRSGRMVRKSDGFALKLSWEGEISIADFEGSFSNGISEKALLEATVAVEQNYQDRPTRLLPGESNELQIALAKLHILKFFGPETMVSRSRRSGMPKLGLHWFKDPPIPKELSEDQKAELNEKLSIVEGFIAKANTDWVDCYLLKGWLAESRGNQKHSLKWYQLAKTSITEVMAKLEAEGLSELNPLHEEKLRLLEKRTQLLKTKTR